MQNDNKNMEHFFDDSWQHMHGLLEEHLPEKKKVLFWNWRWPIAMASVCFLLWWGWTRWDDVPELPSTTGTPKVEVKLVPNQPNQPTRPQAVKPPIAKVENPTNIKNKPGEKVSPPSGKNTTPKIVKKSANKKLASIERSKKKDQNQSHKHPINTKLQKTKLISGQPKINHSSLTESLPVRLSKLNSAVPFLPKATLHHKFKGQNSLNVYTGVTLSSLRYHYESAGLLWGHTWTPRLRSEAGVGVGVLNTEITDNQIFSPNLKFEDNSVFSTASPSMRNMTGYRDIQLYSLEFPLEVQFRLRPRLYIFGGGVYTHGFGSTISPVQRKFYQFVSLDAGIGYQLKRLRIGLGYENQLISTANHQVFLKVKWRVF